jgi:hypothetical protein
LGTPLLFLGLVVLWAAVLIPATRSSRASGNERRSVDSFSTAMRTLSRRPTASSPAQRVILVPTAHVTDDRRKAERARVRRRRRLVMGLVQLAGVSLIGAVVIGGAWVWGQLAADFLLGGVLVALRRSAIREAAHARSERRAAQRRREEELRAAYLARTRERSAEIVSWPAGQGAVDDGPVRRAVND